MTAPARAEQGSRRQALARYAVLDTPPDPAFDDLADLARTMTGAAGSGIGFFDGDRIWFKSTRGFDVAECGRQAFPECRNSEPIMGAGSVALGGAWFSSWAAAPLVTSEGYLLGELFVLFRTEETAAESPRVGEGVPTGLTALARQVQARLELRRTLLSYHAVVDGVGHVVFQIDEDHHLVSVTPTWGRLTRFGVVRSLGRPLAEFVHVDDRTTVEQRLRELRESGAATTFECRLSRLVDGDVPVEVIARPMVDEVGRRHGIVGVIADISERRAREVEVQHAQKLEALGRLSAGLAHEINTPIQFVGDNTRFLAEAYDTLTRLVHTYRTAYGLRDGTGTPDTSRPCHQVLEEVEREADLEFLQEEIPEAISQSLEGLDRVRTLVRAMRTFSHPGEDKQSPADLNEALSSAVTVARNQVSKVADIRCDLGPLPPVICSIGDLNQVFLNLLVNAADAIAESGQRGTLTITSRLEDEHAVVAVSDTGVGIPEGNRLRIFEPFFTTKEVGRGTGQGLAMARAVVHDKHDGCITVSSVVGQGSTFTIRLPVAGRSGGVRGSSPTP